MDNTKKHIIPGRPLQIFMTLLIMLFAVAAASAILIAVTESLTYWRYLPQRGSQQLEKKSFHPRSLNSSVLINQRLNLWKTALSIYFILASSYQDFK